MCTSSVCNFLKMKKIYLGKLPHDKCICACVFGFSHTDAPFPVRSYKLLSSTAEGFHPPPPQATVQPFNKSTLNSLNCPSLLAELHNALHMFSSEPWSTALHANTQCQQLRHGGGIPLGPVGIKKWRMQNLLQRSLCTCWSDIQRLSVHLIIHAPASGYYHPPSANTTRATFLLLLAGTFEHLLGWYRTEKWLKGSIGACWLT